MGQNPQIDIDLIIEKIWQSEKQIARIEERLIEARKRLEDNEKATSNNYQRIITLDRNVRIVTEKLNAIDQNLSAIIKKIDDKVITDKAEQKVYDKQKAVIIGIFGVIVTVLGLILPNLEQILKALE